jgi:hypothetical protein
MLFTVYEYVFPISAWVHELFVSLQTICLHVYIKEGTVSQFCHALLQRCTSFSLHRQKNIFAFQQARRDTNSVK